MSNEERVPSASIRSQAQQQNSTHQGLAFANDDFPDGDTTSILFRADHPLIPEEVLHRTAMAGVKRLNSTSANHGLELTLKSSMADSVIEMLGMGTKRNGNRGSPLDVEVSLKVSEDVEDLDVSEVGLSKGNVSATVSDEEEVRVQWKVDF